jgi:cytochrome oxidase Cu insertion factor (SCO1/SenC/PrrC family)
MTNSNAEPPGPSKELSEEKRAAALRAGRTPVPPKFIMWAVVTFAVLGLGGVVVDHYFGSIAPTPTTVPTNRATTTTLAEPPTSALTPAQYIGLKLIDNTKEFPFTLYDQSGGRWNLASTKGKVVVLTFYNSICNDICPVLGSEISQAITLLGPKAANVDFAIVNTDPHDLGVASHPKALSVPKLASTPSVYFLTGRLSALNSVWSRYGVVVKVGAIATEVTHTNVIYFIATNGSIVSLAEPFGKPSRSGTYSLPAADVHRFATGIAQTASSLVG